MEQYKHILTDMQYRNLKSLEYGHNQYKILPVMIVAFYIIGDVMGFNSNAKEMYSPGFLAVMAWICIFDFLADSYCKKRYAAVVNRLSRQVTEKFFISRNILISLSAVAPFAAIAANFMVKNSSNILLVHLAQAGNKWTTFFMLMIFYSFGGIANTAKYREVAEIIRKSQ